MKKITLFIYAVFLSMIGYALAGETVANLENAVGDGTSEATNSYYDDCINTSSYGSANMSTPGTKTLASCTYFEEYSTVTGINANYDYEFTGERNSDASLAYITVRSGSYDGPEVGSGMSPLTVSATGSDDLYVHWNTDANCGTGTGCATTTATCLTCATTEDCEGTVGGSAVSGTACDDGDAGTNNDVYDADCNCVGEAATAASVCDTAIHVECNVDPGTYSSEASNGTNTTSCFMGNNGLWFSFEGTGGDITVNSSATFDHEMSINRGDCDDLISVTCKDGSTGAETYTIESTNDGEMYYVYIARYNSGSTVTGNITISIECATPPDCSSPELTLATQDVDGAPIDDCLDPGSEFYVLASVSGGEGNATYNLIANANDPVAVDADGAVVLGPFTAGTEVTVIANGNDDDACSTSASIDSPAFCPATNDEACSATALACGDNISQSMTGSTASYDDDCYGTGTADVWFSFTSDGSQIMTVNEDSSFDAVVQLFIGDDCGNLVEAGACKDSPENYTVTEAGTYYFRVRPYYSSGENSMISVSLTCEDYDCPVEQANIGDACDDGDPTTFNDVVDEDCNCAGALPAEGSFCDNAINVDCNVDPVTYSSAASIAANETSCSMGDKGLWFSFEGTGGDITVNSSATFDHEMSISRGACDDLTSVACKDGSTSAETYTIESTNDGEMYYVYIARYNSGSTVTGDITISIECATPPECTAPNLELAAQDVDGAPIDNCIEAGSEYYVLATLSGGDGNTSYNLTANTEDAVEVAAEGSVVFGPFTVGTNVDVSAVGAQDDECEVTNSTDSPIVCPPANDDCDGAIALECDVTITGNTDNATASGMVTTCGSFSSADARDLFYSFEADGTSDYLISLAQPSGSFGLDGVLFVYSGTCDELTNIECSDSGNPEEIELLAPAAGTYIVRFFDYAGTAAFTLNLECTEGSLNVNSNEQLAGIALYPNPMVDQIVIANPKNLQLDNASIYDLSGRLIKTVDLKGTASETVLDVSSLANATYMVLITGKNGQISKLMVKE